MFHTRGPNESPTFTRLMVPVQESSFECDGMYGFPFFSNQNIHVLCVVDTCTVMLYLGNLTTNFYCLFNMYSTVY